ncbi:MAG: DUF948 domain-containing protein [Acidimicrobiia bacterium]|nr:DUF948 domain-containing protein [Acidimicrobiia bacterium]
MSASEWAAVIASVAVAVLVGGLLLTLGSLNRTLRALRHAVDELHQETLPMVEEMHRTVKQAGTELDRVDSLLATAESVGQTVDSASRLAYLTFSNPVIKALAFGAGTRRAYRRMRRDRD